MPFISVKTLRNDYDVIVVGSGAAGGQSAYILALEGIRVLMIEAGRNYDPVAETPMFQTNADAPLRGTETPDKPLGFYDSTVNGGWAVPGEPYTSASSNPDEKYMLWRSRMLGGRTNHWARNSFRNGQYDFKPKDRDGLGINWPINYTDVAPFYDKVEMLVGVYGDAEGIENSPDSPAGILLPPPKPRLGELLAQQRAKKLGIPIVAIHRAVLSQKLDADNIPQKLHPHNVRAQRLVADSMRSRSACFWATPCNRGCAIKANYQSPTVHLPPALASGNLDILTDAMVREVTLGSNGLASGVHFIDKTTGIEHHVKAKAVVLGASSTETIKVLFNSKSNRFPHGLGNSSGLLGKHLMDTVGTSLSGHIPLLENLPPMNEDGAGGDHVYTPWWLHKDQLAGKLGFARGYHIEFATGKKMPTITTGSSLEPYTHGSYGKQFKADARRYYGASISFSGRGEMIPNADSFCDIDPLVKDKWGIPAMRFHWKWSEHEIKQAIHMQSTFADLIHAMGGKVTTKPDPKGRGDILPGGHVKHGVGGAIMGLDPKTSVTNSYGQLWDVKNVMIADAATFCSSADKNPTITIMALAWRGTEHLIEAMRSGSLS
ncbi:MAG: GMC family oxidoreductase [Verrucomicrobiota bacterium]|jgi:choline dehydrogenase-like flavoprotein|nr:MAG: GMC family oxidoreductase [Verrucomicrobiota bacterium]